MKVVCKTNISNQGVQGHQGIIYNLTIGKVYEVYKFGSGVGLYVIDDSGANEHYHESMHTTLVELRNEKIEELLK